MCPMTVIQKDWYLNSKGGRRKVQHQKHKNVKRSLWRKKVNIRQTKERATNKNKTHGTLQTNFPPKETIAEPTNKNEKAITFIAILDLRATMEGRENL